MPNLERLYMLANHLLDGELGHLEFYFGLLNSGSMGNKKHPCGTMGCAIGECPIVFPEFWAWRADYSGDEFEPRLRGSKNDWICDVEKFFNVTAEERRHLFHPGEQIPDRFGGIYLKNKASSQQVANNIFEFINLWKDGKISR